MFKNVITKEMLTEMLKEQYKLNTKTNGFLWALGHNKNKKSINWPRTIYMELAELIDSSPWKHWSSIDAKKNSLNEKIEASDIWHFLMSATIEAAFTTFFEQYNQNNEPINPLDLNENQLNDIWFNQILPGTTSFILSVFEKEEALKLSETAIEEKINAKESDMDKYMIPFEQLMLHSLLLSMNTEKDKTMVFIASLNAVFYVIINKYLDIDLITLYKGKCVLNSFRQDNGYANGTYRKMWKNELGAQAEDNVIMVQLLTEKNIDLENLNSELGKAYFKH